MVSRLRPAVLPGLGASAPVSNVSATEWNVAKDDITVASERAQLAATRVFDVRTYGAVGDNVADDTAALQQCADECETALGTFYIPAWFICKITATLDLRYIRNIQIEGIIRVHQASGIGVIIGNTANATAATNLSIYAILKQVGNANTDPVVRVIGVKNGDIRLLMCDYLQLWADASVVADSSIAYSRFFLGKVDHLELNGINGAAWINENYFYGGRVTDLTITGSYSHNHNKFECSLEHSDIVFNTGNNNQIRGRFEGTCTVTFASGTWLNRVIQTWASNATIAAFTPTVTDSGIRNRVMTVDEADGTWQALWRIDGNTPLTTNSAPFVGTGYGVKPGFRKVQAGTGNPYVYDTGIVPVEGMDVIDLRSDASIWRLEVFVYAASGALLTDGAAAKYISAIGGALNWNAGTNAYASGADTGSTNIRVVHPNVAYLRITVRRLSASSGTWFEYVQLSALQAGGSRGAGATAAMNNANVALAQTGTTPPAESLLSVGSTVSTDTGFLLVTHSANTTMAPGRSGGESFITVASMTGIAVADYIAIELDNGQTHFTTVASIASGINLTVALPSGSSTGKRVKTQRWKHVT